MRKATFAAGCFWGVQREFDSLRGVMKTTVGYTGGRIKNPTYEQVCSQKTGHAEAIEIEYNEKEISYEQLLDHLFSIHNPTQKNRQGPDIGENYRSVIFYHSLDQKRLAEDKIKKINKSRKYTKPIVTQIQKAAIFYPAEKYHQKHYQKNSFFDCQI